MFRFFRSSSWIAAAVWSSLASTAFGGVLRVDASRPVGGNGSSWSFAFSSLDAALQVAGSDDEIWVARGRYRPTIERIPGDARTASFLVPQGVQLYGGFAGNELSLSARAGLFSQTSLSGDVGVVHDRSDNAHVVVLIATPAPGAAGPVRIDGFVISGGNNDLGRGSGLRAFSTLVHVSNCVFQDNTAMNGPAIAAQAGQVRVKWCEFAGNTAHKNGGAIWGQTVSFRIFNSVFRDNRALRGGALYMHSILQPDHFVVANSVFTDNSADRGGAVYVGGNDLTSGSGLWQNCTFAYNSAVYSGGAIFTRSAAPVPSTVIVRNSILWGNSAPLRPQIFGRLILSYSNVQDRSGGPGNISLDPMFLDPAGRDLRLRPGSPSIDAGANNQVAKDYVDVDGDGILAAERTDLDAAVKERFVDDPLTPDTGAGAPPLVDMGAYEYAP